MNGDLYPEHSGDETPPPQPKQHFSSRVPDGIGRGAFGTAVIVMSGPTEFVLDFIQNVGGPPVVVSRIVMPHGTMPQFIGALQKNLEIYEQRFGPPPELPKPQNPGRQQTAQEIYDELKLPDEQLSGSYANGVMIAHTPSEFKFDFLTNLFPHSAVSSRVFLSAPQVPRMLDSLKRTFEQFQEKLKEQREKDQHPDEDSDPPPPEDLVG